MNLKSFRGHIYPSYKRGLIVSGTLMPPDSYARSSYRNVAVYKNFGDSGFTVHKPGREGETLCGWYLTEIEAKAACKIWQEYLDKTS